MRRARSALLWGLVGAMTFLAAVQGYQLVVARLRAPPLALLGVAAAVAGVTTALAYVLEPRLARNGRT
ncbi:MAG: hypothetical protein ABEJ61_02915 [Haloferacaceae archaeon]